MAATIAGLSGCLQDAVSDLQAPAAEPLNAVAVDDHVIADVAGANLTSVSRWAPSLRRATPTEEF